VECAEVHIPDDSDLGTGTFVTVLEPSALAKPEPTISIIINKPVFQISVNFNPATREIPVLLGRADGTDPLSRRIYQLPVNIELSESYTFEAIFEDWRIRELDMDDVPMKHKTIPGTVTFWVDLDKNPGAFTEGINYKWGVFEVNAQDCTIYSEGRTLLATLDYGTPNAFTVFTAEIDADPNRRHMIAVTWTNEAMNLYFDGQLTQTAQM